MSKENSYTKLFYTYGKIRGIHFEGESEEILEHPFIKLFQLKTVNEWDIYQFRNYTTAFEIFNKIKIYQEEAYSRFTLEMSVLISNNNFQYLNECVKILKEFYIDIEKNIDYGHEERNEILKVSIKNLLIQITHSFHHDFNGDNRKFILPWFHVAPPMCSFKLNDEFLFEHNQVKRHYMQHLNHSFIATKTNFTTFKALFRHRTLNVKINWTGDMASLKYFIQALIRKKVILVPKRNHWQITSEFFLLNGANLQYQDFHKHSPTKDPQKQLLLDGFVNALAHPKEESK